MISQEEKVAAEPQLTLEERRAFLKLPLEARRRKLAEQAQQVSEHYQSEPDAGEREDWQGVDIVEY